MKIKYLLGKLAVFIIIFTLFLLFPLLQDSPNEKMDFSSLPVLFTSLLEFASCASLLALCKRFYSIPMYVNVHFSLPKETGGEQSLSILSQKRNTRLFLFFKDLGDAFFCFGLLCIFSALLQGLAFLFPTEKMTDIVFPKGFCWIMCILSLLFSAFYEEAMYRVFVPEYLLSIFTIDFKIRTEKSKKIILSLCELLAALLFAFSHRYLGIFSVLNAALAHITLRFFLKKDRKLSITAFAHFLYNLLSLLLI